MFLNKVLINGNILDQYRHPGQNSNKIYNQYNNKVQIITSITKRKRSKLNNGLTF